MLIIGNFHHSHKNEEKYNKNEFGGWMQHRPKKYGKEYRNYPRIKNGLIFPLAARGLPKEEIPCLNHPKKEKKRKKK